MIKRHRAGVACVYAADGIRFLAIGDSAAALSARVATYVRARCDCALWPGHAASVRALLNEGRLADAIELYFAHVGERWDEEYLELTQPWARATEIDDRAPATRSCRAGPGRSHGM
jgi:hypothetical protein